MFSCPIPKRDNQNQNTGQPRRPRPRLSYREPKWYADRYNNFAN